MGGAELSQRDLAFLQSGLERPKEYRHILRAICLRNIRTAYREQNLNHASCLTEITRRFGKNALMI
jgi:hypothetical protein